MFDLTKLLRVPLKIGHTYYYDIFLNKIFFFLIPLSFKLSKLNIFESRGEGEYNPLQVPDVGGNTINFSDDPATKQQFLDNFSKFTLNCRTYKNHEEKR